METLACLRGDDPSAPEPLPTSCAARAGRGRNTGEGRHTSGLRDNPNEPQPTNAPALRLLEVQRRFDSEDKSWKIRYEGIAELLKTDARLDISSSSGDICIEPSNSKDLVIEVDIRALKDTVGRNQVVKNLTDHVLFKREGNALCIKDRHADDEDYDSWRVCINVKVPRAFGADIRTRTGDIRLRRITGEVAVESVTGDINLDGRGGKLDNVKLVTAAGGIHLNSGDVGGKLEASTTAGTVNLALTDTSRLRSVDVKSLTGSLNLTLPKKVTGRFKLQSEDGNLSLNSCKGFEIRKDVSGESATGIIGEGGATFELFSTAGSICLQRR